MSLDEKRIKFSASGKAVKLSDPKKELRLEYQVFADVVAKGLLIKVGSFDAMTTEKFQAMTAIVIGIKVNWSQVIFNIMKAMMLPRKNLFGFSLQWSRIFEV